MAQYIPKNDLAAEIKRLDSLYNTSKNLSGDLFIQGLFCFIDTIETKEVDLKKEIDEFMAKEWEGIEEKDEPLYSMIKNDLTDVAKHFFELGMAVNNKAQK